MGERTCSVEACKGPHKRIVGGMCSKHYQRFRAHGTTGEPPPSRWVICGNPYCSRRARAGGLCRTHHEDPSAEVASLRSGSRREAPYCVFLGCDNPHKANGLCCEHMRQAVEGTPEIGAGSCRWSGCAAPQFTRGLCVRHVYFRYVALRVYSLSLDRYDEMLASQSGRCAICGGRNADGSWLSVDHDHACCPQKGASCGQCIRGLLCGECNLMIGKSCDDPARLRAAADYLEDRRM